MTRWWISGGQRPYLWRGEKAQVPIMLIHAVHALTVTDTVWRACFEGGACTLTSLATVLATREGDRPAVRRRLSVAERKRGPKAGG